MAVASVHSQWINGELVYYSGTNKLGHIPTGTTSSPSTNWLTSPGMVSHRLFTRFFNDFTDIADDGADGIHGWVVTLVEAGADESMVMTAEHASFGIEGTGGIIKLDADINEDDGVQMQLQGESFKLDAGHPLYYGTRIRVTEATECDALVGLCIPGNTTLLTAMTDGVYFLTADGAATGTFVCELNNVPTANVDIAVLAADTWYVLEFIYDGVGTVQPYVDGVAGTAIVTTIPNDECLTPSFAWLNGAAAMGHDGMFIDWIDVCQLK